MTTTVAVASPVVPVAGVSGVCGTDEQCAAFQARLEQRGGRVLLLASMPATGEQR